MFGFVLKFKYDNLQLVLNQYNYIKNIFVLLIVGNNCRYML